VDLGLAEKLAVRAVATATGTEAGQVTARIRETGDLGVAAEQLLAAADGNRAAASLEVGGVVQTLHRIAEAEGTGSQGRKLELLAGLLAQATPLEARYLLRLVTGSLRLGVGTPTILDALAKVHAGGKPDRPVLERAYNICCDLGRVAAVLVSGGLAAVEELRVSPGNPVRAMLAQRLSQAPEILARLGGRCAAEYKYDGVRVQAHRTADGAIELYTRRLERVSGQFPDVVEALAAGLRPSEAIIEGEVVAYDAAAGELRPFQEVMFRRRKYGIAEAVRDIPVGLFCFELLYADGEDLTMLPYPQRRAALARAITVSPRLRLTTSTEVSDPAALDTWFEQAVTDGCEGLVCKSVSEGSVYQAGARGWMWIKLKRDYRTELSDTVDLVVVGAFYGRGRRRGVYGALLLAAYDPAADVFPTATRCGTGFSDAELAALPDRLAPLARPERPARVYAWQEPDVWFEPGQVLEILSAELTLSPNYTAAWGQIKDDAGLAMRFPRFTGRWRDDKAPEDATTVGELVDLFRTARRMPAGGLPLGVLLDQGAYVGEGGADVLGGAAADASVCLGDRGAGGGGRAGVGDGEQGLGHLVGALGQVVAEPGAAGGAEIRPVRLELGHHLREQGLHHVQDVAGGELRHGLVGELDRRAGDPGQLGDLLLDQRVAVVDHLRPGLRREQHLLKSGGHGVRFSLSRGALTCRCRSGPD
jgi:DNA ligase-1